MWKLCVITTLISLILANVQAGQTNLISEYSITPSNQVAYYHYPAPPKSQQFHDPAAKQLSSIPIPTLAPSPSEQRSVQGAAQAYQNQYQGNYRTAAAITKQFTSPALDNAAFNLALSNQGYTIGGNAANAALTSTSRSSKTTATQTAISNAATASAAPAGSSSFSNLPPLTSLNVKLPLPIGITPLNIAPLPLQAGAPYTAIPNGVTSYGTPYPQRKRR
ncbi:hypothetical protein FF38_09562 [Lucilia cuprina]|uniref:Uncharacterized protein n=1 Tax=Lucilia cuprina TaxID=7375 RepID=A0A0L0CCF4_LUCCU|nr:hypothetical protein CVS40_8528 [Lucilia cuprina]KNC30118.1 hypothetical protein FF38_09562 [Lucilia cuprina]